MELREALPRPTNDSCMRYGYCTAEVLSWDMTKQLILAPDVNEVTMQKQTLRPPKLLSFTFAQASRWLEE